MQTGNEVVFWIGDAANLPLPEPAFLYLRAKVAMIGEIPREYESYLGSYPSSSYSSLFSGQQELLGDSTHHHHYNPSEQKAADNSLTLKVKRWLNETTE